ncbi:DUF2304 domain-containing protein [Microbacterium sp. NPDC019599]|uniref:DUF2304 domain-containing protein n=1 Tax=Microbacterium sp. NPDC019599 TaxID=3154690 RepID=UPI0034047664
MTVAAGIVLAVVIIVGVGWMLVIRALREKYAILWLLIGLLILLLGLFPGVLVSVSQLLGVALPSNLFFALAIILLLGVALHLSWELSQAEDEIRRLAEESALLRDGHRTLEARLSALEEALRAGGAQAGTDEPSAGMATEPEESPVIAETGADEPSAPAAPRASDD